MNTHKSEVGGQRSEVKIEMRDPADLRLHKLQRHIPDPDKKSAEWAAFVDSIQSGGILHPLLITADNQIMDGGWRWRGARQINLPEVPCLVRSESEAAVIITESLLHRKQMTRGAAVYLAMSLQRDFQHSFDCRHFENQRAQKKTRDIPFGRPVESNFPETARKLSSVWGVSHATILQAREVIALFEKDAELKAEWEPSLLKGECNLWNIKSAAGGSKTDQTNRELGILKKVFKPNLADIWQKTSLEGRIKLKEEWRKATAEFPGEMRRAMIEALENP